MLASSGRSTPERGPTTLDAVHRPGEAFAQWVGPHWDGMANLARRLAPDGQWEDVLQDALTDAWRKWRQFDPERGSSRNWLLAIVADRSAKTARRARSRVPTTVLTSHDPPAPTSEHDLDLDLHRAVQSLSRRQQVAVALYYYLDLPVADVAAVMGCSPGTVKSTLSDARRILRSALDQE